jgi:hypothetical protein
MKAVKDTRQNRSIPSHLSSQLMESTVKWMSAKGGIIITKYNDRRARKTKAKLPRDAQMVN